jgi:hypothetical protein
MIASPITRALTAEVNWGPGGFLVAGVLLFGAGAIYTLASAQITSVRRRVVVGAAVLLGLAVVWAELAVGLFR